MNANRIFALCMVTGPLFALADGLRRRGDPGPGYRHDRRRAPRRGPHRYAMAAPPAAAATNTAAPSGNTGGDKTKITLTTWTGADEAKELQVVIDKVNAAATDFEIVHQASPADYYTKLQTEHRRQHRRPT